jgi:hypothetical protein
VFQKFSERVLKVSSKALKGLNSIAGGNAAGSDAGHSNPERVVFTTLSNPFRVVT